MYGFNSHLVFLLIFICRCLHLVYCQTEQCPSGWLRNNDKCYFFSTEAYNWVEAEDFCKLFSSKLAEPRTVAESHFIRGEAEKLGSSFWLGINDIILEDNWVYTSDLSPITVKSWGPGDPNGFAGANCVATYHLSNYHSLWADEPCTQKYRCVCERLAIDPETIIG